MDDIFTVNDVIKKTNLSKPTILKLLNEGEISSFRVGKRRLIPEAALVRWVEKKSGIKLRG